MTNKLDEDMFIQEIEEFFYQRDWVDHLDMLDKLYDILDREFDNLLQEYGETLQ